MNGFIHIEYGKHSTSIFGGGAADGPSFEQRNGLTRFACRLPRTNAHLYGLERHRYIRR